MGGTEGGPIVTNSYVFSPTGRAQVDRVMRALSQALLHGRNGQLVASVVGEQAHTASELLLKIALGATNRGYSFAKLVKSAETRGLVTHEEADELLLLKNMRRDAKHRGQPISERNLERVQRSVVGVLHRLVSLLSLKDGNTKPPKAAASAGPRNRAPSAKS
jgi:hypothetical protein